MSGLTKHDPSVLGLADMEDNSSPSVKSNQHLIQTSQRNHNAIKRICFDRQDEFPMDKLWDFTGMEKSCSRSVFQFFPHSRFKKVLLDKIPHEQNPLWEYSCPEIEKTLPLSQQKMTIPVTMKRWADLQAWTIIPPTQWNCNVNVVYFDQTVQRETRGWLFQISNRQQNLMP